MKPLMFAGAVLCAMSTFVPAAAFAAAVDGAGAPPTCPARGSVKLKPALVTGGAEAGAVKILAKSSGVCSGGVADGSTVVSYKMKGTGTTVANTCTDLSGATSSDVEMTFKWKVAKGSPKLAASTATLSIGPSGVTAGGKQAFYASGTISAGSFTGRKISAWVESDETAAVVLAECDAKGIKKIAFGDDDATNSCLNGPNTAAAITKQITSIDGNDVPHLEVEILTVTSSPYELAVTDIATSASGMLLESLSSTCTQDAPPLYTYRCRHTAFYQSTGACQWDGDYTMDLSYACDPTNTCDLCDDDVTVPFTLDSENFCSGGTEFCEPDLSCSQATAAASDGGVPCCGSTYTPLISCLETYCAAECATVIGADAGIVPLTPCHLCAVSSCNTPYSACSGDSEVCPIEP